MFSSLLRSRQGKARAEGHWSSERASPSPGPAARRDYTDHRYATADFTELDDDDDDDDSVGLGAVRYGDEEAIDDEDGPRGSGPVLPLFSASYLDSLPIYNITHAIRIIVQTRTETTLTWEQLRSPQVSQFLVKPMQQQIRTQHFSRATLYALLANCLQFAKEGRLSLGNAGTSSTRARVCELLAIKLLREYNTRELIDALSYDFYPLQGLPGAGTNLSASRTSTLDVAIRASAKRFLAHPLVVQQLEAIWNGAISFYAEADRLHRDVPATPVQERNRSPGKTDVRTPLLASQPPQVERPQVLPGRRTVTLYDPRHQASLFKLSRLRVPRYRSFLSTMSLAVLIGLFLAVLVRRSNKITTLELLFWFWSAGYMLDELVGFSEQGFSLYIMSFWNIFDLSILALLIVYYCMRAYGVFLVDPHHWNDMAYDVLAANAILLLPRVFGVLDHYQYFSQLLIAFRLMAVDLAAVLVLVLISCSGFMVFFTMSKNQNDTPDVAYKIFQILMGFTPAAWEVWPSYNWLGRSLLVVFLIICHFVVLTVLIAVLTNSFMSIASNAAVEHQFLFAINTISMVKNDALFSYIAPGNIFAWLLMPLRYCMPLRQFVYLNRFVIKATHFPLLFCIFFYERYWLAPSMYEPTDLVEHQRRGRTISFADPASRTALFSPNVRVREESRAGFQKDKALEEVFRRVPDISALRNQRRSERRKTQTAIRNWMDQHDETDATLLNWPTLENPLAAGGGSNDWRRRPSLQRDRPQRFRHVSDIRSAASDPADLLSNGGFPAVAPHRRPESEAAPDLGQYKDQTDADGDDEFVTNDEDEEDNATNPTESRHVTQAGGTHEEYSATPQTARLTKTESPLQGSPGGHFSAGPSRKSMHSRTLSTNTILYAPEARRPSSSSSILHEQSQVRSRALSGRATGVDTPTTTGQRSPRRGLYMASTRPGPIQQPREMSHSASSRGAALLGLDRPRLSTQPKKLSYTDTGVLSSDILSMDDPVASLPGSFQAQLASAMKEKGGGRGVDLSDRDRMNRLVLARMKTLEDSIADMVKEMRELRSSATAPTSRRSSLGDELARSGGMTTIEVAGRQKRSKGEGPLQKRVSIKRPSSRRSMKETEMGMSRGKGKGKEVARSSDDDDGSESFTKKGSSL